MPQFYLAGDWGKSSQTTLICDISSDLAHHLRVRRINPSDLFTVFDGKGSTAKARLLGLSHPARQIEITDIQYDLHREPDYRIELIQGLAGGDKMDWIIEKAVETGAARVLPVESERSVLRLLGDPKRSEKRLAHWQAIAQSACEQCDRSVIPSIDSIQSYSNAIENAKTEIKVLLSPEAKESFEQFLNRLTPGDISLVIGPEGGLSPSEEGLARQAGFEILSLGPRVLRTETAGIVAITAVHSIWKLKRASEKN
jgi:16S rRNA (uracil1498-N3)-methyltransferase